MIIRLGDDTLMDKAFDKIGCDKTGAVIMNTKSHINHLLIKNLSVKAANILKQDALSIGAELAVSKKAALLSDEETDAILMATDKQLSMLAKKELLQPFGLRLLADRLKDFINPKTFEPLLMGVLNINDDSFYDVSRTDSHSVLSRMQKMIDDGADIIDIGGVSSRPGSSYPGLEVEMQRVRAVIDIVYSSRLFEKVEFSLDSFAPSVIEYALDHGFSIINDIYGLADDSVAKIVAVYNAKVVIMHIQGSPETMQNNPVYEDVIGQVDEFFSMQIEKARSFGISKIILDVGIGFGKTLEHNLTLLKHLKHFTHFGYPILVGASRKGLINEIFPSSAKNRLPGTLAFHLHSLKEGASIIRCHDVYEHAQALKIHQALLSTLF